MRPYPQPVTIRLALVGLIGFVLIACTGPTAADPTVAPHAGATTRPTITTSRTAAPTHIVAAPTHRPTAGPRATPRPTVEPKAKPGAGATALCRDGSYSYAAHHQGACSHHGGVSVFYK